MGKGRGILASDFCLFHSVELAEGAEGVEEAGDGGGADAGEVAGKGFGAGGGLPRGLVDDVAQEGDLFGKGGRPGDRLGREVGGRRRAVGGGEVEGGLLGGGGGGSGQWLSVMGRYDDGI